MYWIICRERFLALLGFRRLVTHGPFPKGGANKWRQGHADGTWKHQTSHCWISELARPAFKLLIFELIELVWTAILDRWWPKYSILFTLLCVWDEMWVCEIWQLGTKWSEATTLLKGCFSCQYDIEYLFIGWVIHRHLWLSLEQQQQQKQKKIERLSNYSAITCLCCYWFTEA